MSFDADTGVSTAQLPGKTDQNRFRFAAGTLQDDHPTDQWQIKGMQKSQFFRDSHPPKLEDVLDETFLLKCIL
jgi:hypothetical protein